MHLHLIPGKGLQALPLLYTLKQIIMIAKISMESGAVRKRMLHAYILSSQLSQILIEGKE